MALKDWKFTQHYVGNGEENYYYSNQLNGDSLTVGKSNVIQGNWVVYVNWGNKLEKRFTNKDKALAYAKSYMRTH